MLNVTGTQQEVTFCPSEILESLLTSLNLLLDRLSLACRFFFNMWNKVHKEIKMLVKHSSVIFLERWVKEAVVAQFENFTRATEESHEQLQLVESLKLTWVYNPGSWDSSVVKGWTTDELGFDSRQGRKILLFSLASRTDLERNQPNCYRGSVPSGKAAGT
jgi:hypothetical protein